MKNFLNSEGVSIVEGTKIWGAIVADFKLVITQAAFKTWFSGCFVLDLKKGPEKDLLVLGVKNNFLKEQVENRYLSIIKDVATKKGFSNLDVECVVAAKQAAGETKEEPLFSGVAPGIILNSFRNDYINPNHTFENFVVGGSNNLAFASSRQVIENLGRLYNPLLLYGPTGVGKTHLAQAIANEVSARVSNAKVMYATSEKFTNDFIQSLNNHTQESFRHKYRSVDVLIVDDVQFFAGKESTQDEFFHTFNDLYLSGRQIVLASDKHPKDLGRLSDRLVSRLLGGMTVDIGTPDLEMKIAIIRAKCSERGVGLSEDLVSFIAKSCNSGAREIEGVLISMLAMSKVSGENLTLEAVRPLVERSIKADVPKASVGKIVELVCKHYKVSSQDVRGSSRKAQITMARQVLMYVLRKELGIGLVHIGEVVGRDHSTIVHGIEKVERNISQNQSARDEVLRVRDAINN